MRILTVDDNQANLEFLEGALWIYSCPIDRAKNGLEHSAWSTPIGMT
jgi:CheY-like chemotaxis protein